jgi:hypothetical protein
VELGFRQSRFLLFKGMIFMIVMFFMLVENLNLRYVQVRELGLKLNPFFLFLFCLTKKETKKSRNWNPPPRLPTLARSNFFPTRPHKDDWLSNSIRLKTIVKSHLKPKPRMGFMFLDLDNVDWGGFG